MGKDYYRILGISAYEDNQDVILHAYRTGVENIRQKIVDNPSLGNNLVDINEAFLVLSDAELKRLYDYSLTSHIQSPKLIEGIESKRQRAETFVQEKIKLIPNKRKKRIFPAVLCGFFLLSALGTILRTCSQAMIENGSAPSTQLSAFYAPENWGLNEIANSFTISIPPSLEKQTDLTDYNVVALFLQKGVSDMTYSSLDTYGNVLIQYDTFGNGEVERHNEISYITTEDKKVLKDMCDMEVEPYSYIKYPSFRWIDINGTKALEADYSYAGGNGTVHSRIYLLPNYNELAKIIISYPDKDTHIQKDLDNVIKTFKWRNPK